MKYEIIGYTEITIVFSETLLNVFCTSHGDIGMVWPIPYGFCRKQFEDVVMYYDGAYISYLV